MKKKIKICCAFCGGVQVSGLTTFTADLGFGVFVIRNVPAMVCQQCGDDWLSDEVAARVEKLVNQARKKRSVVEVTSYKKVA